MFIIYFNKLINNIFEFILANNILVYAIGSILINNIKIYLSIV